MPLKEPTPPEKIFTDEFAKSGEVQKVPNDLQADESLSWLGGFTKRFSRIPVKENGLNIIRQTFAGIVQPLSAKILQVEKDLRVRFLKTDKVKIENNDISFLKTTQLTTQKLNANKAKIVDFTKELIKPSEKTIITDLTQNAGVTSGIDTLSIADKAKSVNLILNSNTSRSVLNNTPPDNVSGKELVNAEWVRKKITTAPSPYVHTFNRTSSFIPYHKIIGLNWVKMVYLIDAYPLYNDCRSSTGCVTWETCKDNIFVKIDDLENNAVFPCCLIKGKYPYVYCNIVEKKVTFKKTAYGYLVTMPHATDVGYIGYHYDNYLTFSKSKDGK